MHSREHFVRCAEFSRERRTLPAETYKLVRVLWHRCGEEALFVPVRSMQFLAVADSEEILFVDATASRTAVVLAWQDFRPGECRTLDRPVPFHAVYYSPDARTIMPRLQMEFRKALQHLDARERETTEATILPFRR